MKNLSQGIDVQGEQWIKAVPVLLMRFTAKEIKTFEPKSENLRRTEQEYPNAGLLSAISETDIRLATHALLFV